MTQLDEQIAHLDRASAYEAAQLLAFDMGADPQPPPINSPLLADPAAHQPELEELAKVLLLTQACHDPQAVAEAIEGAGHKQLVLGGDELIALTYLIVEGIRIIVTRGRASEHEEIVIKRDENGDELVVSMTRSTRYNVSGPVAAFLRQLTNSSSEQQPPDYPPQA